MSAQTVPKVTRDLDEAVRELHQARPVREHGAALAKTRRADEALPLLAISMGASVVRTDERIAPADGIGAVLRAKTSR